MADLSRRKVLSAISEGPSPPVVTEVPVTDTASDIHPWDILINGERWAGKVRLVGFVDSFFLICYSGSSRFEHGIVVYSECPEPCGWRCAGLFM
jgi:hypothetical protein